ncbi:hypothetical protein [Microbacterium hydrocarbonoxydans]|uniref:hypothetical protein n=1 Tax=Microbacterium hydrocarbonoxydans TaxID=273678 RepID=UPI003D9882C3
MTSHRTAAHALAGISALVLTVGFLSGCTPEPDPTPTPTAAFASEEEAFAAAEEVYRAYNEALNSQRAGAVEDEEDPQDFLLGTALEGYLDGKEYLRSVDRSLSGATEIVAFVGEEARLDDDRSEVTATVCLDVSGIRVLDGSGADVTPASREDLLAQQIVMIASTDSFLISEESQGEASKCD